MFKRIYLTGLGLLVGLMLLGAGCAQKATVNNISANNELKKPIAVGFIGPLTGDVATLGNNMKFAMEIARDEINREGGINGHQLEVKFEDGKCDAKEATNAANKLINIDKVSVVLPTCSGEVLAASPMAESAKVLLFAPAATNPKITEAGDYVFRISPSDLFQGKFAAGYMFNQLNKRRVAIVYTQNEWASGIKDVFKKEFANLGGSIVAEEGVAQDARDLRTPFVKVKAAKPDAVYFPSLPQHGIVGLKQLKELGLNITVVGGDLWDDVKIPQEAGPAAEGAMYTIVANRPLPQTFVDEMKKRNGGKEINDLYSGHAYDAIRILAKAMAQADGDVEKTKANLYRLKDYQGIADTYTLDENGDVTNANYVVKKFEDGKILDVD